MAIVMAELLDGESLRFLGGGQEVLTMTELLGAEEYAPPFVGPAQINVRRVASLGGLKVCRASSEDAFSVGWPRVPLYEIQRIARMRGVEELLGANVESRI